MFITENRKRMDRPDIRVPDSQREGQMKSCIFRQNDSKMNIVWGRFEHESALTSQEQVAPAFSIEGAESEADEDDRSSQEGRHDDAARKHG